MQTRNSNYPKSSTSLTVDNAGEESPLRRAFDVVTLRRTLPPIAPGVSDAIWMVRLEASATAFFLVIYFIFGLGSTVFDPAVLALSIAVSLFTCGWIALAWTSRIVRFWKLATLLYCTILIVYFSVISAILRNWEPRFIAIMLVAFATASSLKWGPLWQLAMNLICLATFVGPRIWLPMNEEPALTRLLGLLAALIFSQTTAIYLTSYRRHFRAQREQLKEAAKFWELQVATLAHDIRNPVSVVVGLLKIMEDDSLSAAEKDDFLLRIGSAIREVDCLVANIVNFCNFEKYRLAPYLREADANSLIEEIVGDFAAEAVHRGIALRAELTSVPRGNFDPLHLEQIVKNMLNFAVGNASGGEVVVLDKWSNGRLEVEVRSSSARLTSGQIKELLSDYDPAGRHNPVQLGLYVSQLLAQVDGGTLSPCHEPNGSAGLALDLPLSVNGDLRGRDAAEDQPDEIADSPRSSR